MNCPICKGTMEQEKDTIDGVSFDSYKCGKCGESIVTMPQLKALADKYRQLRKAKDVTFAKWGNSLAVRIPADVAADYNLTAGKKGVLTKEKGGIRIIPG
jgi:DNA-directed RNA polymerase subunit M/transcription elongation factor TFIIS